MTDASDGKRDFFISFTGADRRWARWLARTLAEAGYRFWFQDQDFAGSIPRNIEKAHEQSNRTILLLSDAYAQSGYCRSEWEMRYQEDPGGEQDLLILFRVAPAAPPPLLRRIAYVDLFGCQDEATGRELVINRLRQAIEPGTKLPLGEIIFPGVETPFPVPQHNLPPFNPDFVGREPILAELRSLLTSGRGPAVLSQAISGLGGVGKTQTALAYCYPLWLTLISAPACTHRPIWAQAW
jgi:TIR domain